MMRNVRSVAGGMMLALLGTAPAGAALTTYYHAGSWHAFSGTDAANRLVCGIGTENAQDGRSLTITAVIGGQGLFFRAIKPSWAIPAGTPVPVLLRIGRGEPWSFQATGDATHLEWGLGPEQAAQFDPRFRGATSMALSFPTGSEPPWVISLAGSNAVNHTFARCITDLTRREQGGAASPAGAAPTGPTQPFGAPATQPFSPQAAPGSPPVGAPSAPPGPVPAAPPATAKPGG